MKTCDKNKDGKASFEEFYAHFLSFSRAEKDVEKSESEGEGEGHG
jgi:hypothetical protein